MWLSAAVFPREERSHLLHPRVKRWNQRRPKKRKVEQQQPQKQHQAKPPMPPSSRQQQRDGHRYESEESHRHQTRISAAPPPVPGNRFPQAKSQASVIPPPHLHSTGPVLERRMSGHDLSDTRYDLKRSYMRFAAGDRHKNPAGNSARDRAIRLEEARNRRASAVIKTALHGHGKLSTERRLSGGSESFDSQPWELSVQKVTMNSSGRSLAQKYRQWVAQGGTRQLHDENTLAGHQSHDLQGSTTMKASAAQKRATAKAQATARVGHAQQTRLEGGRLVAKPFKTSQQPFQRDYSSKPYGSINPVLNDTRKANQTENRTNYCGKKHVSAGHIRKNLEPYHPDAPRNLVDHSCGKGKSPFTSKLDLSYGAPAVSHDPKPFKTTKQIAESTSRKPIESVIGFTNQGVIADYNKRCKQNLISG